jgi:hypothetical protein
MLGDGLYYRPGVPEHAAEHNMDEEKGEVPGPPEAPDIERKLQFDKLQLIGVPILMLLPILALFGLFGETFDHSSAETAEVALHVEYPSRYRHGRTNPLRITVTNRSPQPLAHLTVAVSRDYVERFSEVAAVPEITAIDEAAFLIEFEEIPPGAERRVLLELRAWEHGYHRATVWVNVDGVPNAETFFTTIVFP